MAVGDTRPEITRAEIDRVCTAGVCFGCILADTGYKGAACVAAANHCASFVQQIGRVHVRGSFTPLAEPDALLFDIPLEIGTMTLGSVRGLIPRVTALRPQVARYARMPLVRGEEAVTFRDGAARNRRMMEMLPARAGRFRTR